MRSSGDFTSRCGSQGAAVEVTTATQVTSPDEFGQQQSEGRVDQALVFAGERKSRDASVAQADKHTHRQKRHATEAQAREITLNEVSLVWVASAIDLLK